VSASDADTQWTAEAQARYGQRAEDLVIEIRRHVDATLQRQGRQAERQLYFQSAERVESAAKAFNDAEFDWCGSFPLALADVEDDDAWDDDEEDSEDDAEESRSVTVLSVVSRSDYHVTDADALIAAGRVAYSTAWPDDTDEDAQVRVQNVVSAAAEIKHAHGLPTLQGTAGLEPHRDFTHFVAHAGESDEAFQANPFAIIREDGDV
jgi:hypothetical protein